MFGGLIEIILGSLLLVGLSYPVYRYGYRTLIGSLLIIITAALLFSDSFLIVSSVSKVVVFASVAGITFRYKRSLQFFLISASVSLALLLSLHHYFLLIVHDYNFFNDIIDQFKSFPVPAKQSELMKLQIDAVATVFKSIDEYYLAPVYFFLNNLFLTILSFLILRIVYSYYIVRASMKIKGLEYFKLDERLIIALITFFAGFIFIKPEASIFLYALSLNGMLILVSLYFIQSLGIIRHFLIKKRLPLIILPLGIVLTVMINATFFPVVAVILAGWGILDVWTDFRNFNKSDSDKKS